MIELPSKRVLRYWRPIVKMVKKKVQTVDEEGAIIEIERESRDIQFYTPGKDTMNMLPESTYSGKLVENVTQAVARDLLADATVRLEAAGYPPVVHVHDSIACEVPAGFGNLDEFCSIMAATPDWAPGLPIEAKGYRDTRFRG
jgi:DNA polymerase